MWLPKVSIIIPVYNGSNYLKEAIDSAIAQTYPNTEIIVVNDGSCDDNKTEEIALSYGEEIIYLKKDNGGVSSALNHGISHMTGEYFSWLSHDDMYHPDKIKTQIHVLQSLKNNKTVLLSDVVEINAKSDVMPNGYLHRILPQRKVIDGNDALIDMYKHGTFYGCSLLIHKTILYECGLFDERYRYTQDFLMWSFIFLKGYSLYYIPAPHVYMRVHDSQLSQTGRQRFHDESFATMQDIVSRILGEERNYNILSYFATYNALYNNPQVVNYALKKGKEKHILSFSSILKVKIIQIYGYFRPIIRRVYYRIIKRVKTQ